MIRLVLLAALLLQEPQQLPLVFVPPKDAKPAEIEKAAKVIEKRCAEYGYKGVAAKMVNGEVEVSCETGITKAMNLRIVELASRPYAKIEFMLGYPMKENEREQYEPGKNAPKGASWVTFSDGRPGLVIDATKAVVTGRVTWKPNGKDAMGILNDEPFFEFDEALSKTIKAQSDEHKRVLLHLLIDGRRANSNGYVHWKDGAKKGAVIALWRCEEAKDAIGGLCLNNPLPFALEPKK